MTSPSRPTFVPEGPTNPCRLHGQVLDHANCTPISAQMGADRSTGLTTADGKTHPKVRIEACAMREEMGDWVGGTTLPQVAKVLEAHGVDVELHVGANVASPYYLAVQLQAGRSAVAQGNAGVLINTVHRSTGGYVNHAVEANEVRGGVLGHPKDVLVYDPEAQGRIAGWGKAAKGPQWWTWPLFLAFCANLRPAGDARSNPIIGAGRIYCAILPDTEPHVHLKFGSKLKAPFPDHVIGKPGSSTTTRRFRASPGITAKALGTLEIRGPWVIYQELRTGGLYQGSRVWYGDHDGGRWLPESAVTGRGGT